jgi:hypothetical protein
VAGVGLLTADHVKPWDRVLYPLMAVSLSYPLFIVAGLDHRFGWSPRFPTGLNILGLVLCALGYALVVWAMLGTFCRCRASCWP